MTVTENSIRIVEPRDLAEEPLQTFPEHGGKWQISTSGGDFPVWSRDGRELYFIGADRKLMSVEVKGNGKSFQAGVHKPLFEVAAPPPCQHE